MLVMIGVIGGLSHLLLTESYRHAPASVVAPFDYTAMLWAFMLGYFVFGELPSIFVYVGAAIVVACGLFVLWRERQLGARDQGERDRRFAGRPTRSKRLEADDRLGVLDAGDLLDLLVDEMADVGRLIDVEFHQQIELARGRIDFRRDLRVRQRVGDLVGFAERAFDLDKKRNHSRLRPPDVPHLPIQQNLAGQRGKAGGWLAILCSRGTSLIALPLSIACRSASERPDWRSALI